MGGGGEAQAPICSAAECLGMRARGWKASAIVAGDLGFGCARKTTLQLGPGCQRTRARAASGERRWQVGRGVGRAVTERDWAERGWAAERAQGKGRREWAAGLMMDWVELVGLGWVSLFPFLFSLFYLPLHSNSNQTN
jgi:hypothetical protein